MELASITHFCEFLTASGAGDIQLDLEMADLLKVSHTHTKEPEDLFSKVSLFYVVV